MSARAGDRPLDIVLLGATGFTGALSAAELSARAPEGLRWALAGRSRPKLEAIAASLDGAAPELVLADTTNRRSLRELAESTRVLVTTVGPYAVHGWDVVDACARSGTDYLDLTGEPEFVDRTYADHHVGASETGARLIHACGFDSIPYDLGVQYTVGLLPGHVALRVRGYVRAFGLASGGTLRTVVAGAGRVRQNVSAHMARRRSEPAPAGGRRVAIERPRPHRALGAWALPLTTLDPLIVRRSARALERYGPDFTYGHYAAIERLPVALAGAAGIALGGPALLAAAQIPPARAAILRALEPWAGPSPERIERGWFSVRFVGEGGGERIVTEVAGGDPGYGETAKMLAESALCIACDKLPETAGQVTTAVAMGPALRERLVAAGLRIGVVGGADADGDDAPGVAGRKTQPV